METIPRSKMKFEVERGRGNLAAERSEFKSTKTQINCLNHAQIFHTESSIESIVTVVVFCIRKIKWQPPVTINYWNHSNDIYRSLRCHVSIKTNASQLSNTNQIWGQLAKSHNIRHINSIHEYWPIRPLTNTNQASKQVINTQSNRLTHLLKSSIGVDIDDIHIRAHNRHQSTQKSLTYNYEWWITESS